MASPGAGKLVSLAFQTGRLTSPSPICLAEHLVEFGVGPDRANFLRAAAGDGDLGSPFQSFLA